MTQTPPASLEAYQIKITLVDSAPEVWRQVVVSAQIVLSELHKVIQLAMGWESLHPYSFQVGLGADKVLCEPEQRLSEVLTQARPIYYTYDFESGWLHRIALEALDVSATDEGSPENLPENLPICIAGESACPPEGTGGVWGFEEMLLTIEDPEDPNYLEMLDKYGAYDPLAFSLAEANRRLASVAAST